MASPYVLSNYQLQYLSNLVHTRYQLYFAVHNLVAVTTTSSDLILDTKGLPTSANDVDLLAQHRAPYAPQANFGSNRIAFAGEALFFDGSRSTQRGNLPCTNFVWSAPGSSSVTTNNGPHAVDSQASIVWNTPGNYTVSLSVSDRFGSSSTGVRQVTVYPDRASAPRGLTGLSSLAGSISGGGWQLQLGQAAKLVGVPLPDAIPIGSYLPVTLLCETEYEVSPGNWLRMDVGPYAGVAPGQFYSDPRIVFSGYLATGTANEDDSKDTVAMTFQTAELLAQAASVHNIGYYNTTYATRAANGVPLTLKTNPALGHGQLVTGLSSEDVYRSLLGDHSVIGRYHDVHLWRDYLPQSSGTFGSQPTYWAEYSNLTAPEGSVWDALQNVAQNEYASVWCERDSSFCVGPLLNMRGYELLDTPTNYNLFPVGNELDLVIEKTGSGATADSLINYFGAFNYLHNLWGPARLPQAVDSGPAAQPTRDLSGIKGPPVAFHLSDIPVNDPSATPPNDPALFPWVTANWPQDLSVRPFTLDAAETYTGKSAFVKLTMTMPLQNNQWTAWFPGNLFDQKGNLVTTIPAGVWQVLGAGQTSVLPDVTIGAGKPQRNAVWAYLWEMCRRVYASQNASYSISASLAMAPWAHLGDLALVTRQRATSGPSWSAKPFQITAITHSIDLAAGAWRTQLQGSEVTTYGLGSLITPPFAAPQN